MNRPTFTAPTLEAMNGLLSAFEFTALIAATPHGAVFMATQRSLERHVAIKLLSPEVSSRAEFRASFETTARAMAKLNHPNLIGVYDSGIVAGMLYFVMEFVPGKSLEHSSRDQFVECTQALKLIEGVCTGLAHAHDHGIIHGNLNPSNVLLNQKAEPIIGNFGFSHPAAKSRETDPVEASYIAPEITAGKPATAAADVFAVGAMLYRLLTARPHTPDAPPPSQLVSCPPRIDAVWRKATDPDPAKRHQSVRDLQSDLKPSATAAKKPLLKAASPQAAAQRPAAAPPLTGPQLPPKTRPVHKVGFNWKLLRNLVIIAGLLYAIKFAWDFKERKAVNVERQNREALAKAEADKKRAIEEARKKALANGNRPKTPPSGPADRDIAPPPPSETAAESLERLRSALADGDRSELPKDSQRRGDNDYLLVTTPLTWTEASWFAEQHGAHLAIPNASADLTWLVTSVAKGSPIWIGAGRSGRSSWTLSDGTPWTPGKQPSGLGPYLCADKHGLLRAVGPAEKMPFVIQWRRDGSNPAALAKLFKSTADSIAAGKAVFPPGIRVFDNRFYLTVSRDITWRNAVDLAASSGGHLAVASDLTETSNLQQLVSEFPANTKFWIGGFLRDNHWLWITGEPWKTAKWATDADQTSPNGGLCIRPKDGWDAADISGELPGFIIEWSTDRKGSTAADPSTSSTQSPVGEDIAALTTKAAELLTASDRKRGEALAANAGKFSWDLDIVLRSMNKGDQSIWSGHVARLKASVINNRLPTSIPRTSGIILSDKMSEIAQYASTTQARIDTEFATEAERVRSAFVTKVRAAETDARESGQIPLAETLATTAETASSLDTWVSSLGLTLRPENPVVGHNAASGEENRTRPQPADPPDSLVE